MTTKRLAVSLYVGQACDANRIDIYTDGTCEGPPVKDGYCILNRLPIIFHDLINVSNAAQASNLSSIMYGGTAASNLVSQ